MKKINNILFGINIGLVFAIFITMLIPMITFTSCEKKPVIPDCELNNYGNVTVINNTGYNTWVDVTWGNVSINYEKLLYNGDSYKYTKIPAGSIEIWITFDNSDWYYEYESLSACEDMRYTWYLSSIKSAGGCPFVLMLPNGEQVEPILKEKN